MFKIPGFQIQKEIYSSSNSRIFEGIEESTGKTIIVKILQDAENQSTEKFRKFLLEFQILKKFDHPGIVKPIRMIDSRDNPILLLEYGGTSLRTFLPEKKFLTEELISIAIQLAEILGEIHSQKIIHKDINPGNILYGTDTGRVKIIDFGISSILSKEKEILKSPNVIEGTLAYISPEQTGRMNRIIDYRTDFYSLGITLFELFTGNLPFLSKDSMELIHQHLTAPTPVIHNSVPEFIIRIINKLMSKNAEDRYQSAYGLKIDLQNCLTLFRESRGTLNYKLGREDISPELNIPQKLYGREGEIQKIMEIFEGASNGPVEVVLVSGYSGTGKSALVQELYKPITKQNGYFLSGKFDQLQKDIPYSALVHAFRELVAQIMTEPNERIQYWKESFLKALSPNAGVILGVIPELEEIFGKQPPVPELEPKEAQNRFNLYFERFIRVILKKEHPLVIFLDDLQWADGASLRFMQNLLLGRNIEHFLFIGAYRDNEVYAGHPSMVLFSELEKGNLKLHPFLLEPLKLNNVLHLLNETFPQTDSDRDGLANLVVQKTEGNPFFLRELLKTLYEEEELQFLHNEGKWVWNMEKIMGAGITGNVVELMTARLKKFPESTRNALKYAACIGSEFDVQTLSTISKTSVTQLAEALLDAIHGGLILSHSNDHKFLLLEEENTGDIRIFYKFVHDRIQQAAYLLIPEDEKQEFHRQIGEIYLSRLTKEEFETKIFDLVGHLNKAKGLLQSDEEKRRLAEFNLLAGKRAKRSAAYEPSYNYLKIALDVLGENSWEMYYNLTYEIYLEIIESAHLSNHYSEMEKLVEIAKEKARDNSEKVNVMIHEMSGIMAQGRLNKVIQKSIETLELLNIYYKSNPSKISILSNYLYLKYLTLINKENIISKGAIIDKRIELAIKVLHIVAGAAVISNPNFGFYLILKVTIYFLKYGFSRYTSMSVAGYSFVLAALFNNIPACEYYCSLTEKLPIENSVYSRTSFVINALAKHWYVPYNQFVYKLYHNYQYSIEVGDIEFASHSITQYFTFKLISGTNLIELDRIILEVYESILRMSQAPSIRWTNTYQQFIYNLTQSIIPTISFDGNFFLDSELMKIIIDTEDSAGLFNILLLKNLIGQVFRLDEKLFENTEKLNKISESVTGNILKTYFAFLDSLILLNSLLNNKIPKKYYTRVKANQKKMKYWADHAPFNRLHLYLFIEGKIKEYKKKPREALELYEQAIEKAREHGFTMDEALFCEEVGRYCTTLNKKELSEFYITKCWKAYEKWGARLKVKLLEEEFSYLRKSLNPLVTVTMPHTTTIQSITKETSNLDLDTILKFSQTISGEIEKDKLLANILQLVIQNAGADSASIFLEENGRFILSASISSKEGYTSHSRELEESSNIVPVAVIRYVANRKESILINDALVEGNFTSDPYIQNNRILSLLSVPLMNQGKIVGILYLENRLIRGAFSKDRTTLLNMITSQAAISLENAKLYDSLEEKVLQRTLELQTQKQQLESTLSELRSTQEQLVEAEKSAALGQLISGVAHEINNPLAAIRSSAEILEMDQSKLLEELPYYFQNSSPEKIRLFRELQEISFANQKYLTTKEERQRKKSIRSRFASIPFHSESTKDEILEYLSSLYLEDSYTRIREEHSEEEALQILKYISLFSTQKNSLKNIKLSTEKSARVIFSLRKFLGTDIKGTPRAVKISYLIESSLSVYDNYIRRIITIEKDYSSDREILCVVDEILQVLKNLIFNAIQSMYSVSEKTLRIQIQSDSPLKKDEIFIAIEDRGMGISKEIEDKLFNPFFTTKSRGEGIGLGLYVSRLILKEHGGSLEYVPIEKGAKFLVRF